MAGPAVSREQVLGFRAWAQGLVPGSTPDRVLDLGVQDTPYGSAPAALAVRGAPLDDLHEVWSWRGAPHLHRGRDLAPLAEALWPLGDEDAHRRVGGGQIEAGARRGAAVFAEAAQALREVVRERLPKGEVSREVSARVPADLTYDCAPCGARHVSGGLLQAVGLAAGVRVVPQGGATLLEPLPADVRPADVPAAARGIAEALLRCVRALGPLGTADLAAVLGTTPAEVRQVLPDGLVEVTTPTGAAWVAADDLDRLESAYRPELARLLPPSDPWLQARDRELVVPDKARRTAVWRALSSPGAVLVDGEVAGTWRGRTTRRTLQVTVEPFAPLAAGTLEALQQDAATLAAARGATGGAAVTVAG